MPSRVTVDENGFVVSVEPMPERNFLQSRSKRDTSKKVVRKKATRKLLSWEPRLVTTCSVCGTRVKEGRIDKHLRKVHPEASVGTSRSQAKQAKPRIPSSSGKRSMVLCSACNVYVRTDRWDSHVRKVHSSDREHVVQKVIEQPKTKTTRLPTSNLGQQARSASGKGSKANLEAAKRAKIAARETAGRKKAAEKVRKELMEISVGLKKLARGFHAARIEELRREQTILQKELKDLERTGGNHTTNKRRAPRVGKPSTTSGYHEDSFCSSNETRYGGKYLGQVRREWDGKFGSLPLYDDYGEESDPG